MQFENVICANGPLREELKCLSRNALRIVIDYVLTN